MCLLPVEEILEVSFAVEISAVGGGKATEGAYLHILEVYGNGSGADL